LLRVWAARLWLFQSHGPPCHRISLALDAWAMPCVCSSGGGGVSPPAHAPSEVVALSIYVCLPSPPPLLPRPPPSPPSSAPPFLPCPTPRPFPPPGAGMPLPLAPGVRRIYSPNLSQRIAPRHPSRPKVTAGSWRAVTTPGNGTIPQTASRFRESIWTASNSESIQSNSSHCATCKSPPWIPQPIRRGLRRRRSPVLRLPVHAWLWKWHRARQGGASVAAFPVPHPLSAPRSVGTLASPLPDPPEAGCSLRDTVSKSPRHQASLAFVAFVPSFPFPSSLDPFSNLAPVPPLPSCRAASRLSNRPRKSNRIPHTRGSAVERGRHRPRAKRRAGKGDLKQQAEEQTLQEPPLRSEGSRGITLRSPGRGTRVRLRLCRIKAALPASSSKGSPPAWQEASGRPKALPRSWRPKGTRHRYHQTDLGDLLSRRGSTFEALPTQCARTPCDPLFPPLAMDGGTCFQAVCGGFFLITSMVSLVGTAGRRQPGVRRLRHHGPHNGDQGPALPAQDDSHGVKPRAGNGTSGWQGAARLAGGCQAGEGVPEWGKGAPAWLGGATLARGCHAGKGGARLARGCQYGEGAPGWRGVPRWHGGARQAMGCLAGKGVPG